MSEIGGVRVHFGHSNYYARRALEKMEEQHGMLSAEAANAATWDGCDDLFVDSGGFQLMLDEGEHPPLSEYLQNVRKWDGDRFACQDYPCEPKILSRYGRSVREHQSQTTEAAAQAKAAYEDGLVDAEPVTVIQGWEKEEYLRHVDELREQGCLTPLIGIGSVCRRNAEEEIRDIIMSIRSALGPKHTLHAFGVKYTILRDPKVRRALESVDTTAWYYRNFDSATAVDQTWQEMVHLYLEYRRKMAAAADDVARRDDDQQSLTEAVAVTDGGSTTD